MNKLKSIKIISITVITLLLVILMIIEAFEINIVCKNKSRITPDVSEIKNTLLNYIISGHFLFDYFSLADINIGSGLPLYKTKYEKSDGKMFLYPVFNNTELIGFAQIVMNYEETEIIGGSFDKRYNEFMNYEYQNKPLAFLCHDSCIFVYSKEGGAMPIEKMWYSKGDADSIPAVLKKVPLVLAEPSR